MSASFYISLRPKITPKQKTRDNIKISIIRLLTVLTVSKGLSDWNNLAVLTGVGVPLILSHEKKILYLLLSISLRRLANRLCKHNQLACCLANSKPTTV